jgi:hypothetical protein
VLNTRALSHLRPPTNRSLCADLALSTEQSRTLLSLADELLKTCAGGLGFWCRSTQRSLDNRPCHRTPATKNKLTTNQHTGRRRPPRRRDGAPPHAPPRALLARPGRRRRRPRAGPDRRRDAAARVDAAAALEPLPAPVHQRAGTGAAKGGLAGAFRFLCHSLSATQGLSSHHLQLTGRSSAIFLSHTPD